MPVSAPDSAERTLVLLKPDAVRRGLVGEILRRYEAKGLRLVAMDMRSIDAAASDEHYSEHVERDFYPPLRDFVTSGPLVALVLEGDSVIEVVRGADLFWSTSVHRLLQQLLGLPPPAWRHHRLVPDDEGRKLSKSTAATGIRELRARGATPADIRRLVGLP